jgi:hypothetical protein
MSNSYDGGPAFPVPDNVQQVPGSVLDVTGMSLRDYFAAKALPLAYRFWFDDYFHPNAVDADLRTQRFDLDNESAAMVAESAYELADAMLAARNA